MKAPRHAPLVGYNTGVQHKDRTYHIQTEDVGANHSHVVTHLFADGGRIVATRKTSYARYVDGRFLVGVEPANDALNDLIVSHAAMYLAERK